MRSILRTAKENKEVLETLKVHIGRGLQSELGDDDKIALQVQISEINAEFNAMITGIKSNNVDDFDDTRVKELMDKKTELQRQLDEIADVEKKREITKSRLDDIFIILEGLANHPMQYDDQLVRQLLECVVVESKERIKLVFAGGLEIFEDI